MHIFYTPGIAVKKELPEEESQHCVRVLRLSEGEEIMLVDGAGTFYRAVITIAHQKHCAVDILETIPKANPWNFRIQVAFAPTKNMDRTEWFLEKATEIGVDEFSLLKCRYSERKEVKTDRLEKILISAMKQSLKSVKPLLNGMTDFETFVKQPFAGRKFIAHCYDENNKHLIKDIYKKGENALILIGPEGDFSSTEVELALKNGFEPVSLGESRLRTETAALVACHTLHVLNQ